MYQLKKSILALTSILVLLAGSCTGGTTFATACKPEGQTVNVFFLEHEGYGRNAIGRLVGWDKNWITLEVSGGTHHYPSSNVAHIQELGL